MNTEDLLVAVLHKVGNKDLRLTNNVHFARLFNDASKRAPEILGEFAWHPQYHDSKALRNALQVLDLGGAIVRENASLKSFRVAPRVLGEYGKSKFEELDPNGQKEVEALANEIKDAFEVSELTAK
jgi:hypothetical protein